MAELVAEITNTLEFHFELFETFCGDSEQQLRLIGEAEYFASEHDKITFITLAQILKKVKIVDDAQIIAWGEKAKEAIEDHEKDTYEQGTDAILDEIGIEQRTKNYEQMNKKFLPYLIELRNNANKDSSSSDSDSDSSSSGSDDDD